MTNCIFCVVFFSLFYSLSVGSLRYSQINRVFMSVFKGMLEASMITIDENGEPIIPFYNKNLIENYIDNYFKKNIERYTKDYEVEITYRNENNESFCEDKCRVLNIKLLANINFYYSYEKSQSFFITSRSEL